MIDLVDDNDDDDDKNILRFSYIDLYNKTKLIDRINKKLDIYKYQCKLVIMQDAEFLVTIMSRPTTKTNSFPNNIQYPMSYLEIL